MAKIAIAYVGNTNNVELNGLKSDLEDEYLNNYQPTLTVKDSAGNEVDAATSVELWPVAMSYVAGSDGNYVAAISYELELVDGESYTAVIDVDASDTDSGERFGHWELPFIARVRTK